MPDPTDAPLRAGMSATAIITTAEVDDAMLVPNRYITLDRDTGKAYVYKLVNNQPALQEVELGLRNERESQVLAGLDDGDDHRPGDPVGREQLRGALFGGGEQTELSNGSRCSRRLPARTSRRSTRWAMSRCRRCAAWIWTSGRAR